MKHLMRGFTGLTLIAGSFLAVVYHGGFLCPALCTGFVGLILCLHLIED